MRKINLLAILVLISNGLTAQQTKVSQVDQRIDFSSTAGNSEGTIAFSYIHNWRTGEQRRFEIGLGARITSYFGSNKNFYTAPARLARSTTIPFLIVFAGHQEKNIDTLTVQKPFVASLNISANFGYNFGRRWYGGINIDLVGFTVGGISNALLISNGNAGVEHAAKPASFNLLLTGDNDYGSLNSEFFARYKIAGRWQLKAVYQFYFVEYKTQNIKQIAPDGTIVDRFRNKVNAFGLGASYDL